MMISGEIRGIFLAISWDDAMDIGKTIWDLGFLFLINEKIQITYIHCSTHVHTYIHTYTYTHINISVHTYMHTYIYIHTHTHTPKTNRTSPCASNIHTYIYTCMHTYTYA